MHNFGLKKIEHLELIKSSKFALHMESIPNRTTKHFESKEEIHQYMLNTSKELEFVIKNSLSVSFLNGVEGEAPPAGTIFQFIPPNNESTSTINPLHYFYHWINDYFIRKRRRLILEKAKETTYNDIVNWFGQEFEENIERIYNFIVSTTGSAELFKITIPSFEEGKVHHLYYKIRKLDDNNYELITEFIQNNLLIHLDFTELVRLSQSYL